MAHNGIKALQPHRDFFWCSAAACGLTPRQQSWREKHWLLQYDLMFGEGYAAGRMGLAFEEAG